LRVAVSSVPGRTTCFFMSHNPLSVPKIIVYTQFELFSLTRAAHSSVLMRFRPEKNEKYIQNKVLLRLSDEVNSVFAASFGFQHGLVGLLEQ
jgi:hypothetical protein